MLSGSKAPEGKVIDVASADELVMRTEAAASNLRVRSIMGVVSQFDIGERERAQHQAAVEQHGSKQRDRGERQRVLKPGGASG